MSDQGKSQSAFVVGLAASSRRNGNTETLLDRFLEGAERASADVTKIFLPALQIQGCLACHRCQEDGECTIRDDFQRVRDLLFQADVVVFSTPVYFWNVPAQAKAFIDRNQSVGEFRKRTKRALPPTRGGRTHRCGVLLAVAADSAPHFQGLQQTVRAMFRTYDIRYWDDLLITGLFDHSEIRNHPDLLQAAFHLGRRAVVDPFVDH